MGPLKNGDRWGCGRRFGRKSNLMRHFRSKTGRKCIEPLLEEQDLQSNSVLQIPVAQNDLQGCLAYFPWPHAEQVKAKNTLSRCSDTDKSSGESSAQPESDWQHTVATNRLFAWPAVKALIGPLDYDPEYLMKLERKQENDGMTSQSNNSPNSCPFPGKKGHSPSSVVQDGSSGVYHTAFDNDQDAEINSFGQLQLTGDVIWRYYQSYLDRIHNLHPFLEGPRLDVDIKEFIKWYCPRKLSPAIIIDTPPRYSYPDMKGTAGSIGESPLVMSRRDLLTELDVPASGISKYEHHIPFPREKSTIVAPENDLASRITVMMIYSGQVYLHKSLNRVYANLYNGKHQGQKFWSLSCVQEAESVNLDLWRFSLPKEMRWNDDEDPAKDIGKACLRAKYYRARYMIHRPLLYNVLHYEPPPCLASDDNPPTASTLSLHTQSLCDDFHAQHNDNDTDSMRKNFPFEYWKSPKIELSDLPSKLRRACKVCVDSAIRHTTAFDGIENGLVVTNIFGIAHA
ncbi:hypothetical protein PENSTE_c005G09673 [Penicillium steckii]|uniref:C2H2-type domain-containing protein n=1 Tax=Penicillium steckii TaxID=303698 RepID=A0A1V6TMI8_9EURO|nr:hypothetical protein PENSTE_c005G09673 [Penicillium steckii]